MIKRLSVQNKHVNNNEVIRTIATLIAPGSTTRNTVIHSLVDRHIQRPLAEICHPDSRKPVISWPFEGRDKMGTLHNVCESG